MKRILTLLVILFSCFLIASCGKKEDKTTITFWHIWPVGNPAFTSIKNIVSDFNEQQDEYVVKAMFVFNFTKYIDWSTIQSNSEFVISVYGNSEITRYLEKIAISKKVNEKQIVIKKVKTFNEAIGSQILFIPQKSIADIPELSGKYKLKCGLIISEGDGAVEKGAHIALLNIQGKIRFELNGTTLKLDRVNYSKELESLSIKKY